MALLREHEHRRHPIAEFEDVGALRRAVGHLAAETAGLRPGEAELVATELGTNLLKHAVPGGYVLYRQTVDGIELLSVDTGPGMDAHGATGALAPMALGADGLSAGLASIRRIATDFDTYSAPTGTVVLARLGGARPRRAQRWRFGGVNIPLGGEGPSGDAWGASVGPDADTPVAAAVIDGLGHGDEAGEASRAGLAVFHQRPITDPEAYLRAAHEAMRGTRGGVGAACVIDVSSGMLTFAGGGNISGQIVYGDNKQYLASTPGTLGTSLVAPKMRSQQFRWPAGATLIMVSDGIRAGWSNSGYPGLLGHDPSVVAAVLHRDFTRLTDDATVMVLRDMS